MAQSSCFNVRIPDRLLRLASLLSSSFVCRTVARHLREGPQIGEPGAAEASLVRLKKFAARAWREERIVA
jgi:hypothetical protein